MAKQTDPPQQAERLGHEQRVVDWDGELDVSEVTWAGEGREGACGAAGSEAIVAR